MWHIEGRRERHFRFQRQNLKERDHLEDLNIKGR